MNLTFRIDDVSVNTNPEKLKAMLRRILAHYPGSLIVLGVSPMVQDMSGASGRASERIFPAIFNAHSDHRLFFKVRKCGIPAVVADVVAEFSLPGTNGSRVQLAGHGLIHVDHRLLGQETQELSILTSCALLSTDLFIPPFNKWNQDTDAVCKRHGIHLVKFEDGWRHLGHELIVLEQCSRYYFHTHDFELADLEAKLAMSTFQ